MIYRVLGGLSFIEIQGAFERPYAVSAETTR